MKKVIIGVLFVLLASPSLAHDLGCDHKPVPEGIKASCCGPADYHRLDLGQISEDETGYIVQDGGHTFHVKKERVLPPPDGCAAIFYSESLTVDGVPFVFCLMIPMSI